MKKIKEFEEKYTKKDVPKFDIGDTVSVHVKIQEEGKTRIQVFEGTVIKRKGSGVRSMFTVRRISYGEGVERTFPLHSPSVAKVDIKKKGSVRRAKLYYLRKRKGKQSKIAEKIEHDAVSSIDNVSPREKSE
jgi:large subunit ribosomal protein L19